MTRIYRLLLTAVCAAGILSTTFAADVRKNKPSTSAVKKTLEEIGGEHFPANMKVSPLGPIETESTYYHAFYGALKNGSYHLIFFDNTPAYLGYYLISLQPTGYGEGEVELYLSSNSTAIIPIPDTGPPEKIRITEVGQSAKFMRAPVEEEPEEENAAAEDTGPTKPRKIPEYRSWTITKDGKELSIESAIFIDIKDGEITLKDGKKGLVATVPVKALSSDDKAYLKDLLQ